jgi:cell division protein FtsA
MAFKNLLPHLPKKEEIVAILDIGSSKIVCLIASIKDKKINIIGSGCHSANGFKNGNISDSSVAKESIIAAVDQAEKEASITVENIILALNGNKIRSHHLKTSLSLRRQKVTDRDINSLIDQGIKELEAKGYEVIHYFPTEYIIDDNNGIKDPRGLLGSTLEANIHFVTVPSVLLENIINCLGSCQLDILDCVFAPYAAGLATLSNADKELGATIIDFGAGITSYAIFSQNNMVHCGFIPIGSMSITNDIAKSLMIDMATAERMKTIHGAASVNYTDNQKMINYNSSDYEETSILNAELNEIISARIDEIFSLLQSLLEKHYILHAGAKHNIVLTGGGSMLTDITKQASKVFASKARLGKPLDDLGLSPDAVNATYSAAMGVLQYLSDHNLNNKSETIIEHSIAQKLINWLKNNF